MTLDGKGQYHLSERQYVECIKISQVQFLFKRLLEKKTASSHATYR